MEPIVNVKIRVPGDRTGNVTGDLASMGGSINGTNMLEDGVAEISGQAPLRELQTYHSRLKSTTSGEGSFSMEFSHYARVQDNLQKELMAAYRGEGTAMQTRENVHRMAEANKAFAHFAWR